MGQIIEMRRRYGAGVLPYDAEVEYLQSTGTQYIDTGISLYNRHILSIYYDYAPAEVNYNYNNIWSTGTAVSLLFESWIDKTSHLFVRCWYMKKDLGTVAIGERLRILAEGDGSTFRTYRNGALITSSSMSGTANANVRTPVMLFRGNSWGKGKLYSVKITIENETVCDYIPVRIGNVGYMYDRVNRKLFGNAGTGTFVVGPDVVGGGSNSL